MSRVFTVAAAQYPIDRLATWQAYKSKLVRWVESAAREGAQLLVFPEYGGMELASLFGVEVERDLGRQLEARGVGLGDASQRQPVLVGDVDGAALDVVERDQPAEHRREPRRGISGAGGGGRALGHRRRLRVGGDLVMLKRQRDRLRPRGRAQLRHRVAHVRAHGLRGEHQLLRDLRAAHALGEGAEDLALAAGQRNARGSLRSRLPVFSLVSEAHPLCPCRRIYH